MRFRRMVVGCLPLFLALALHSAEAQEPKIVLSADDLAAEPGETITVPLYIENLPDSISALDVIVSLSRPDVMAFLPVVHQTGTLTDGWSAAVLPLGDHSMRVQGSGGFPPVWMPIPPNTTGTLLEFDLELYCAIPDTMQDRTAELFVATASFSTPQGESIVPIDANPGSVTAGLRCPNQGDSEPDGFITALDLGAIIGILFEGAENLQEPCCPSPRFDFDCDGFVTSLDLAAIIDHLYAGGPPPCIP
jgi:hypothetical protein